MTEEKEANEHGGFCGCIALLVKICIVLLIVGFVISEFAYVAGP